MRDYVASPYSTVKLLIQHGPADSRVRQGLIKRGSFLRYGNIHLPDRPRSWSFPSRTQNSVTPHVTSVSHLQNF